jgi:hypothetical protein
MDFSPRVAAIARKHAIEVGAPYGWLSDER